MILTVTLNPSVDRTLFISELHVGDTNRVTRHETDAGGKGVNLSRMAAELGGSTFATGFLAGNPGNLVHHVLNVQGVEHEFIEVAGETRWVTTIETEAPSPPTTFNEPGPEITDNDWSRLLQLVEARAPEADWICLGGSLPPGVPEDALAELGRIANEHAARLLLDADGANLRFGLQAFPEFVKPNVAEAERLLERELPDESACLDAARQIRANLMDEGANDPIVVISRGGDGAVMACSEGLFRGEPVLVEVRSTVGSGDSMLGGMLVASLAGHSWAEALRWGLAAGAATATTGGTEIGRRPVFDELLPQATVSLVG